MSTEDSESDLPQLFAELEDIDNDIEYLVAAICALTKIVKILADRKPPMSSTAKAVAIIAEEERLKRRSTNSPF